MRRAGAAAAVCAMVMLGAPIASANDGGPGDDAGSPSVQAAAVSVTPSWTQAIGSGAAVSTSSPVLVDNGGDPFVAAADSRGRVRAYSLDDGAAVAGWGSVSVGFGVRAPLSSDGQNVYVPVATDGTERYPRYKKFGPGGQQIWDSNPSTALPNNPGTGFLLSGLSLAQVDGAWRGFAGSSGHWIYGVNADNGSQTWRFRNADSTMATPAVTDLFGAGRPQVVTSNDTTAEFPWDRNGGILRIFTTDGLQICSATQLANGSTYAASGYNNSSPAVGVVDGRPLIAFGSTGPVQFGAGGNQVVAYNEACGLRWASPPLAAQAQTSPILADVAGNDLLQVVQVVGIRDGANTYPRVYVLNAANGAIIDDTGSSLRGYGAALAYPPSVQLTTADVDNDGAQDLFVPAAQGSFLILNGRTLNVMGSIPTNMALQNTPIVTDTPGGVRITMAGYNGLGSVVSSYIVNGATMGNLGWTTFGADAQRSGTQGDTAAVRNTLLEGQTLASGATLRSADGKATASMQADGNLVVRRGNGSLVWHSGTQVAGSTLTLQLDGQLTIRAPGGSIVWRSRAHGFGTERLVIGNDGWLRVRTGHWSATRRLTTMTTVWRAGAPMNSDRLSLGQIAPPGAVFRSRDGSATLEMQRDGNLVYRAGSRLIWHSNTRDPSGEAYAQLRSNGDLVVMGAGDRLLFSSQTAGRGAVTAVAANGRDFVIDAERGRTIWRNGVNEVVK